MEDLSLFECTIKLYRSLTCDRKSDRKRKGERVREEGSEEKSGPSRSCEALVTNRNVKSQIQSGNLKNGSEDGRSKFFRRRTIKLNRTLKQLNFVLQDSASM